MGSSGRALLLLAPLVLLQGSLTAGQSIAESLLGTLFGIIREGPQEPRDRLPQSLLPQYDFIVVGAGTAGCAMAARLSEVPDWKVLLIEAGRSENFAMDIPIVANMLQFSDANWKYRTVPSDTACLAMVNRQCNYPRGKVMGGSSVLNYMVANRGHRKDYDNWSKLGNKGWSYDEVLPYFKKLEDLQIPELQGDKFHHNTGGPLTVSYLPWRTPIGQAFLDAGKQLGYKSVDYNGARQVGFSPLQTSTRNGTRWSSNHAYLGPARNRPNLHVAKESQVVKILIDPTTKTAYGVEFVRNRRRWSARARREVILSAGSINSPQLLMLSGVGPREHLEELGIPVIQDLSVGYNLMDHVSAGGLTFILNDSVSIRTERVINDADAFVQYFSYRTGPMSITGGIEALAFYDLGDRNNPDGWPNLELLYTSGSLVSDTTLRDNFGLDPKIYDVMFGPILNADTWTTFPMLMRPRSKGRVKLRSRNPLRKPLIYHNYFEFPEDLDVLVDGVLETIRLSDTPAFQKYASKVHDIPVPGCRQHAFGSRDYWRCHIRHFSFTIYHQSGTCKMAPNSDPNAVVDQRLRVYGIKNLRVVDASIFPEIPAGHTNVPTYMVAEKAADMIKEDHGRLPRSP